ncbi:GATA zinc finger domain-containing protein 14-like [Lucilia sericata]|uniref:GATA zinc finger domain-containing protein 14-like n=1 Tax=Lucilia sericata TaxID=13632 RepID=UPI0018A845A6|nr:GATA zinc finger domain-containing protein 14-like [Lucilia sericata]
MISTHVNNNNNTWSLNGPHIAEDHMPRRRKRHFSKMSLMLMIFISCCSILILSPLVQAKESNKNNATANKGETMLSTDQHQGNNWAGIVEIKDKNTFKRLKSTDFNDDDDDEVEDTQEEEEEGEEEEHSSEVIEMIQPAHNLRHQEHYKQRILMAEKDFQLKQQKQQKKENAHEDDNDDEEDYDGDDEAIEQERELSLHNRNLRYQQIQLALREPMTSSTTTPPPHHHRRHEHHLAKQRLAKQAIYNTWPPQQHHLRHQHHHHLTQDSQHHNQQQQQQQQSQLHHNLKAQMRKQNLTHNNKPLYQRYFDRESSYMNPPSSRLMTTEGPQQQQQPHLRHTGRINKYWKTITYTNNPHNHLYNDEAEATNNQAKEDKEDIKRISLSLDEHEENENDNENEKANKNKEPQILDETAKYEDADIEDVNNNDNVDTDAATTSEEDDYSYDDDDDDKEINKSPKYPTIQANDKTNVKRYTNPLRPLYKPNSYASYNYRPNQYNYHLRHAPQIMKASNNNNNNNGEDYDDTVNYEDDITSDESTTSNDDDDDDKFSDEKWNKIEHEHYRKQLQHQRAMQALRSRRPSPNDNTPHTSASNINNNNKYSSYSPAAAAAAWTKRQTMNDVRF